MTPFPLYPPIVLPRIGEHWHHCLPVGSIIAFGGNIGSPPASPPSSFSTNVEAFGWMVCDGRPLKIAQYPELYEALGTLYGGSGDTFNLPDCRGYFLRGVDGGSGNDPDVGQRKAPAGGSSSGPGSTQGFALQTHEHIYKSAPAPATPSQQGSAAGAPPSQPALTEGGPTSSLSPPGNVQVSQKETRPINIYVNYLIKFKS